MRPDAVFKCIANYSGKTKKGEKISLSQGKSYFITKADNLVFLNDYEQPAIQLPWLEPDEFSDLEGDYLEKESDMR